MQWLLERISARSLPIYFGASERRECADDFKKLVQKKILVRTSNLDEVGCELCGEDHNCQVREEDGKLFYVCENGGGWKELVDDDVALFEYDNNAFLKLIATELRLKTDDVSSKEEGAYTDCAFFRIGTYEDKKMKAEAFYLRNADAFESSLYFSKLGNVQKVLITNIQRADIVMGKENLFTCVLKEILAPNSSGNLFDKAEFMKCFKTARRIHFDKKQGHLSLDGKRICTVSKDSQLYYFLLYLWDRWMQQVSYSDIYHFVKDEMNEEKIKNETTPKFCHKLKNEVKNKCPKSTSKIIDQIITTPTMGHYMMADPL